MKLIKSISGIRGIVGETLSTSVVNSFANIFTHIQPRGDILLARDTRYHGEDFYDNICDTLTSTDATTNEYWIKNSIYWFRKSPAILHASKLCKTPLLIFLDADSDITPIGSGNQDEYTIDEHYVNFAKEHDVLSRHRKPVHTETGHIVFNLEKRGKEFIEAFWDYYISGKVFDEPRWDDCWVFDVVTEKLNLLNGPLSRATGAPFDFESIIF